MDLECLDHVHFSVPDLQRAKRILGPFLRGRFVDDYGGPAVNAYGGWNTSGGDFIEVIEAGKPVFGGPPIAGHGILSVSLRVADIDRGIEQARAAGLQLRSRIGSEDIGLGKNVIQAQFQPEPVSGLPLELIEHQLPGEYVPLTDAAVDHVEFVVAGALEPAVEALERIFGSPFDREVVDVDAGLRTRTHRRLGIRLCAAHPTSARGAAPAPGLRAIAFHGDDLERDVETARGLGLEVVRRARLADRLEVDFAPWAGFAVRLVERA